MTDVVPDSTVAVRVSAASARQLFHGCEPDYIRDVCHGRCCDAPTRPSGTLITIHRSEEHAIRARGATVTDGLLDSPARVCPFKTEDHLCGLHCTPDKPLGCIASPFTLTRRDTLIVRNRYRRLVCYGQGAPAYMAFRASLDRLFGPRTAGGIVDHLDAGGGDLVVPMDAGIHQILVDNDRRKRQPIQAGML